MVKSGPVLKMEKRRRMKRRDEDGYAVSKGLFSKANAEYYEGIHAYNKGYLTSGNEKLLYFARAATAFTRFQTHAKQVYNALVPPATMPEDLGPKPYKK